MLRVVGQVTTLILGAQFSGWDSPTDASTPELVMHAIGGGLLTAFVLLSASRQSD